MAFLDDIFGGLFGQQDTPQFNLMSPSDLIGQANALAPSLGAGTVAYNRALLPLVDVQLEAEQRYDPRQAALRRATTESILNELNLGSALPKDVQDLVIQNALETSGASGFGVSPAGRGLVARDLGLTSLDLGRARRNEALGAVRSAPSLSQIFAPQGGLTPSDAADLILGNQQAQNEFNTFASTLQGQNRRNLFETPLRLAGTVFGAATGLGGLGGLAGLFGAGKGANQGFTAFSSAALPGRPT